MPAPRYRQETTDFLLSFKRKVLKWADGGGEGLKNKMHSFPEAIRGGENIVFKVAANDPRPKTFK
ncbi:MAG: hypothetical protein Q8P67_04735 [archaeon]|nr:hypothetical protein [archaeon]